MECRVMKLDVGWGYALFHFPMEITGQMVRQDIRTKHIKKENFLGKFEFEQKYLDNMSTDVMFHDLNGEIKYYFLYYMEPDDLK